MMGVGQRSVSSGAGLSSRSIQAFHKVTRAPSVLSDSSYIHPTHDLQVCPRCVHVRGRLQACFAHICATRVLFGSAFVRVCVQAVESGSMRPEGPVKALRIVLAVTVAVFICMAAVDHSFSSNSIRTAATNGVFGTHGA